MLKQNFAVHFSTSEDGQSLAEYVLILTFVAMMVVSALSVLGSTLKNHFEDVVRAFGDSIP